MQGYVYLLKESRKPMAQNVEEIAQILSRLQEENKINSDDVNRILVDIKSKVDYLNNNSDENSLLIDGLKEAFEIKKSADIERFKEFTDSLEQIKITLSTGVSSEDFTRFLDTIHLFEAEFKQTVSGLNFDKQSFFEGIQDEIGRIIEKSVILKDLFPQKEQEALNNIADIINENINNIKDDINNNVNTDFNTLSENIASVISRINTLQDEFSANTASNINSLSEEVKASASKLDSELGELKSILDKNFQDNTQFLTALNDANFKVSSIIQESKKELNDNINSVKSSFDGLYALFEDLKNEIKQSADDNLNRIIESIKENSTQLADFKENVSIHLTDYLTSIKDLFIAFSEDMKNSQEALASDIFDKKLQELEVISRDITNLDLNLAQKEDNYKSYVSQKIDELQNFIASVQESIKNSENTASISLLEKISALEAAINNTTAQNEKFEEIHRTLEEYASIVNNFASNTDIKFGESISEITEIKDYIANTSIKLDDVQNNIAGAVNINSEKVDELKNTVSNQLNNVNTKLFTLGDELKQELSSGNNSVEELKDEINTNVNSNFNDVKTILECMRANVSQCSDNINGKIDEYNGTITNNNETNKEILNNLQNSINETLAMIEQSRALSNDRYVILEENLKSNLEKLDELFSGKTSQYTKNVDEKFTTLTDSLNLIKSNLEEKDGNFTLLKQNLDEVLGEIEKAKINITDNQLINNSNLEQSVISNLKNTEQIISEKISLINETLQFLKTDFEQKLNANPEIVETLNSSIQTATKNINKDFQQNFSYISKNIETALLQIEQAKNDISEKQTSGQSSLEEAVILNLRNAEENLAERTVKYSQDVAEKFDTLSEYINSIKTQLEEKTDSADDIAEKLNKSILAAKNEINENIKEDFNSMAQSIGALLAQIENAKKDITANNATNHSNLEQSVISNLRIAEENIAEKTGKYSQDIVEKFDTISDHISAIKSRLEEAPEKEDASTEIAEKIDESILSAKNEINQNIKEDFNSVAQSIGALLARIEAVKSDITSNNVTGRNNLEQSIIANLKTTEETLAANSAKYSGEVTEKLEAISDNIAKAKAGLEEVLNSNSSNSAEKLLLIESKLNNISDEYEQNLAMLQAKLGEYVMTVDKISEDTNSKLDNSINEFIDIKLELNKILDNIKSLQESNTGELSTHLIDIIDKLGIITESINNSKDEVKTDVKEVLQENINFIDKGLGYLTLSLDEIKSKQSENYDLYTNSLSDKINSIKQEIELVNTDVVSAMNTKSEEFIKEFEPLKQAVDKFLEFDFNEVIGEIKNQVELSYLNLLSELNDNLIENHDAYIRIENTYKDIASRCASLEDYINSFTKDNLELLNSTIANIDLTVRSNLEKTNSLIEQWQQNIDAIEEKITENRNSYQNSLTALLEDVKNTLDAKIDSGNSELKDCLAVMLNNEDLMYTLESIGGDLSEKINEYKSHIDESSENIKNDISTMNKTLSDKLDMVKLEMQNTSAEELASAINQQAQNIIDTVRNLHEKVDILAMDDNSEICGDILDAVQNLHNKVDILAMSDNSDNVDEINDILEKITSTIKSLHDKIDILAMADNSEMQSEIDEIYDLLLEQKKLIEEVSGRNQAEEVSEKINEKLSEVLINIDKTTDGTDKIAETLKILHEKVDILALTDDSDLRDEIDDIKNLIYEQRKLFEEAEDNEKAHEIDNYLTQLLSEINKIEKGVSEIDLDKNARDIKDSVMTAILSVTDQISFVEETEEIKDFVEEKTDAINRTLLDVKKQLNNITNSGDDMDFYSYTLQDVESDIAKLRLILNDISTSNSSAEVGVISTNINRIAKSIEDLRQSLTNEESFELKTDFEKLNEDILSLSARTNKLLLNSDESYRIICDSLDEFNRRTSSLEERLNILDNRNIENRLSIIDEKVNETMNSNKVLKNVMMYLGEWMDGTSETISGIYEKAAKASSMRGILDELKETVPEKEALIKTIEERFEEQQNRIDRLEKKLEKAIAVIEERDENLVLNKIDKLENQLSKLSLSIEKLASYVDE
mgnify:FL=1